MAVECVIRAVDQLLRTCSESLAVTKKFLLLTAADSNGGMRENAAKLC